MIEVIFNNYQNYKISYSNQYSNLNNIQKDNESETNS
jgi:hypothetical protein